MDTVKRNSEGNLLREEVIRMTAKIEAGAHWEIHSIKPKPTDFGKKVVCENKTQGVTVLVEDLGSVLKIPAPHTIDPSHASGEGVYVSQLKDEEGLDPQVFLNVPQSGSVIFFEGENSDCLKIKNI